MPTLLERSSSSRCKKVLVHLVFRESKKVKCVLCVRTAWPAKWKIEFLCKKGLFINLWTQGSSKKQIFHKLARQVFTYCSQASNRRPELQGDEILKRRILKCTRQSLTSDAKALSALPTTGEAIGQRVCLADSVSSGNYAECKFYRLDYGVFKNAPRHDEHRANKALC